MHYTHHATQKDGEYICPYYAVTESVCDDLIVPNVFI